MKEGGEGGGEECGVKEGGERGGVWGWVRVWE